MPAEKLKRYPQFDAAISAANATAYATNPLKVARHAFLPFIEYEMAWNRFARAGDRGEPKKRRIRYAARRDSYIYSYYRHLLSERYERILEEQGLSESVLAYRRIKTARGSGKCNVHFALEAFEAISEMGNCSVIALDISKFFEHLDHRRVYDTWRYVLGVDRLPDDHFAVFKSITNYSYVLKTDVYRRLNFFGAKRVRSDGKVIEGYLVPHHKIPTQLCSAADFREKIAGQGQLPSLIHKNTDSYGVPQGAPLSDLIANMYLLLFDLDMQIDVRAVGGKYFRYSDDILLIIPGANKRSAERWMKRASHHIKRYGDKLEIKKKKATVHTVKVRKSGVICERTFGDQAKNGIEYLGFRFDGTRVFIRDSTLSNLQRKVARVAHAVAMSHVRRYSDRTPTQLAEMFDYDAFVERFGKVQDFEEYADDKRRWTFWTYANKVIRISGSRSSSVRRQLRRYRNHIRHRIEREIIKCAKKRKR